MSQNHSYDVIVVGAGNAGLTAALAARESGARVLVLESAPEELRGGNSRFSGGLFRTVHGGLDDLVPLIDESSLHWLDKVTVAPYPRDDYLSDWTSTSAGRQDPELMRVTVDESFETLRWMKDQGVKWELPANKLIDPDRQETGRKVALPPGGAVRAVGEGAGLVEYLFDAAERAGIDIWYDAPASDLLVEGSRVLGVQVRRVDSVDEIAGRVILASGGFEANPELRLRYLGQGWDLVKVRGTRYNMGGMLTAAMACGAAPAGHWGGAHAVPIDANAPDVGDLHYRDKFSRYSYPYALLVNAAGERFIDEGEQQVWLTYAKTGWAIQAQHLGLAYQIFDAKTVSLLEPRYVTGTPIEAATLPELAEKLGLPADRFTDTVETFNAAVRPDATVSFDPFSLDGVGARPDGQPPKSNWAQAVDTPPFVCYPVTTGITFTYGGLRINPDAEVLDTEGRVMPGLYAVGEVSGDFFYHNYGAGSGLMRGSVFGVRAGRRAAQAAGGAEVAR